MSLFVLFLWTLVFVLIVSCGDCSSSIYNVSKFLPFKLQRGSEWQGKTMDYYCYEEMCLVLKYRVTARCGFLNQRYHSPIDMVLLLG